MDLLFEFRDLNLVHSQLQLFQVAGEVLLSGPVFGADQLDSETILGTSGQTCCARANDIPFMFLKSAKERKFSRTVTWISLPAISGHSYRMREALMDRVIAFRSIAAQLGLRVSGIPSAICPVFVGHEKLARATSRRIAERELLANLVEFPAVPKGAARFRFQMMSTHELGAIRTGLQILAEARESARSILVG